MMNPQIWRACAGGSATVRIPKLHSRVYYFPQGHADYSSPTPQQPSHLLRPQPPILCHVSAVRLLADSSTDEVFAKLLLIPIEEHDLLEFTGNNNRNEGDQIIFFSKILTPSDANNGGGFSIPRGCALSIFPVLNLTEDKPTQFLDITDVHGKEWRLCHVYRGSPKRHLFTTGWSKFVDNKKLVAGDTIIFMKDSSGRLYVGIRRNRKLVTNAQKKKMEVTEKLLAEAVDKAAKNMVFEVVYYPKPGEWDFVVDAKIVDEAMKIDWVCGMKVKTTVDTEDSSKRASYEGTVTSIYDGHWRMLQVEWNEPKALKSAERVSPWEVELVSPTLALPLVPTKKFRADHHKEGGDPWNQTLLSYDTSPVGIQGARHDSFSSLLSHNPWLDMGSSSSRKSSMPSLTKKFRANHQREGGDPWNQTWLSYDTSPIGIQEATHDSFSTLLSNSLSVDMGSNSSRNSSMPKVTTVSTELTLASSQSNVFSSNFSDTSLHSYGNTTKDGCASICLLGETIFLDNLNSSRNSAEVDCNSTSKFDETIHSNKSDSHDFGCGCGCSCSRGNLGGSCYRCKGKRKIA